MSSLVEKISEVVHLDAINYNTQIGIPKWISRAVFNRYKLIGSKLDYELLLRLDMKGKEKITLGFAEALAKKIANPDHQVHIYEEVKDLKNQERIKSIDSLSECNVCCETRKYHFQFSCCKCFVCLDCVFKHLETLINGITYSGCKCPLCNSFIDSKTLSSILTTEGEIRRYNSLNYWFQDYGQDIRWLKGEFNMNLWRKNRKIIKKIEEQKKKKIGPKMNFDELVSEDETPQYYGVCQTCCPPVTNRPNFFNKLTMTTVDKECVNAEGDLVVLKEEMFECEKCKGDGVEIKKCPHCGIKTVQPDGCNYVICGNHRWCFICNERLPINHEGHNVHYWTGPGSGPYGDRCRRSENYGQPHFVLEDCDCGHCVGGSPLCRHLDCMERVVRDYEGNLNMFCQNCKEKYS